MGADRVWACWGERGWVVVLSSAQAGPPGGRERPASPVLGWDGWPCLLRADKGAHAPPPFEQTMVACII